MITDQSYNRLLDYLRDFLTEWRRDNQEARFFRMVELGLTMGYTPEGLADYCHRFQNASRNGFHKAIPEARGRMIMIKGDGHKKGAYEQSRN